MIEITDTEFKLLKKYLLKVSGIEVPPNKRYLFTTRLTRLLRDTKCQTFSQFYSKLITSKDLGLQRHLIQAMTIHESSFFRDIHPFVLLENELLPKIAAFNIENSQLLTPRIRILSIGCSLGQEPYSIAINVHKWLKTQDIFTKDSVTIIAADISEKILLRAQKGVYTEMELGSSLSKDLKQRYFYKIDTNWEVIPEIKNMVKFIELNLSGQFVQLFGKFDIIFCRNVTIYFPYEIKKEIYKKIKQIIYPHGALIIGAVENLFTISDEFTGIHKQDSTYYMAK